MSNDPPPPYGTPPEEPEVPRYDTYPQYGTPQPGAQPPPYAAQPPPYAATPPPYAGSGPATTPTSGKAIASLVLGILGFFCCPIASVVGIVLGRIATGDVRRSQGRLGGAGLATAGFVVSIVSLVAGLGFWGLVALGAVTGSETTSCTVYDSGSSTTTDC